MFDLLRTTRLTYRSRCEVGGGVTSFVFTAESPVAFHAGQHGFLRLGVATMKPFSLASCPADRHVLIGTSLASGSRAKARLAALRPGDTMSLLGPIGTFTLERMDTGIVPHSQPVVMLAQGVGITPMRSMLAHLACTGAQLETILIHVAASGHAYRSETETWATQAHYLDHSAAFTSAVAATAAQHRGATFFVAGASAFVSSTARLLRQQDVPRARIRRDAYLGYKIGANASADRAKDRGRSTHAPSLSSEQGGVHQGYGGVL